MATGDTNRRRLTLPVEAGAARVARAAIGEWLRDLPVAVRGDVLLVLSELVTNAVKYGAPPIAVTVERAENSVTFTVGDEGSTRPRRSASPGADGGFGLHIIEYLSDELHTRDARTEMRCRIPLAAASL